LWSIQIHNGEYNAHNGSSIIFTLNSASTNEQVEWSAEWVLAAPITGIPFTLG